VVGKGSVFTIKLPAVVSEPEPVYQADEPTSDGVLTFANNGGIDVSEPLPPSTNCVLVIDDDPAQRNLLHRFLSKDGFNVRTASGGEVGLRLAKQLRPIAITLDVMMPEMDGWTVLSELKADPVLCNIPVIMLTMVDDPDRGFTLGATEYATKPVDRQYLLKILRKYIAPNVPCPVLLVEDDDATREITRKILEKEGLKVSEAINGQLALESVRNELPCLILLDLMMPEMDGFQFIERMRSDPNWRTIPIVVLTAKDLDDEDRLRLNGSVETILLKTSYTRDELLRQVRELLADCTVTAKGS
jgi:CheY-like chemotaxis protein